MKTNRGKSLAGVRRKTTTCKACDKPWQDHWARRLGYIEIEFRGPNPPGPRDWGLPEELLREIAAVVARHFAPKQKTQVRIRGLERSRNLEQKWESLWAIFGECWRG